MIYYVYLGKLQIPPGYICHILPGRFDAWRTVRDDSPQSNHDFSEGER